MASKAMKKEDTGTTSGATVPSGYMAAARAAKASTPTTTNTADTSGRTVSKAEQAERTDSRNQTRDTRGTSTSQTGTKATLTGTGGGSSGGRSVTYIGNNGSKNTGTIKVTPGTTPDYYNQLGQLYKTAYDEQVAANNAALEAARQRAQETTDAQIAALAEEYAGTNRALYRDYMNSRRTLPQQLAAMGYNGGLSESSMLRLNNSYEEGLNENERARLAQEATYNQALAQQLYEAQARATEANQSALQNWYGQQATLKDMIYRDAQQRAATMAASGDFSEYKNLGFSDSEIKYLKQMWKRMNRGL